ncbi:hypothetical protein ACROYT_G013874 [Oculina patagonica]
MVHCFAPECDNHSKSHKCSFFGFPSKEKKRDEYRRWIRLLRKDREPGKHARVCSCHFRNGNKSNGPEIFKRNEDKIFPVEEGESKKKKKFEPANKEASLKEMIEAARTSEQKSQEDSLGNCDRPVSTTQEIILEAEL